MSSNLLEGIQTTVIGMGVVFFVLALLSMVVGLFKYLNKTNNSNAVTDGSAVNAIAKTPEVSDISNTLDVSDDLELAAVISAAIASTLSVDVSNINIRSIRQLNSKWKLQSKVEQQN